MPEEQWAQLTFKFTVRASEDPADNTFTTQYNVFERRLADKLSYLDWKLSYVMDMDDFKFLHAEPTPFKKLENTAVNGNGNNVQRDIKQ